MMMMTTSEELIATTRRRAAAARRTRLASSGKRRRDAATGGSRRRHDGGLRFAYSSVRCDTQANIQRPCRRRGGAAHVANSHEQSAPRSKPAARTPWRGKARCARLLIISFTNEPAQQRREDCTVAECPLLPEPATSGTCTDGATGRITLRAVVGWTTWTTPMAPCG